MKPPPITLSGNVPTVTDLDHEAIAEELESLSAPEVLEWMFDQFGSRHYIACSFQKTSLGDGAPGVPGQPRRALLLPRHRRPLPGDVRDPRSARRGLGIEFDRFHNLTIEEQAEQYGDELWKREPDACCGIRKVEPMRRALSSVDCWVAGVRRADSSTRAGAPKFAWDKKFGIWKLNPIADWSERDVWNYIHEHRLPYNPLHDRGYPSIGCTHCTQPVGPGGDLRDGRWAGVAKTECGIN